MASKIEAMYTSTLVNTVRLMYLSEYLFLTDAQIPSNILQKLEKEILKQTKDLAKSRKKIEESMKKIRPKMYDPMWTLRHPIEVDIKPGRRESKKSREGSAMKNMKSNELKPFYEAVDGLEKQTKEVNKFFKYLGSQNMQKVPNKLEKAKTSKAKGSDHISVPAHLFNEGALNYLNELFRCARSETKDISQQTQPDVFKKYITQIMNGKEALLHAVAPLATGKKPNKFAVLVEKALHSLNVETLQKMPSRAARIDLKLENEEGINGQINNLAEYQEQKMKDLEKVEVKPFTEFKEEKPPQQDKAKDEEQEAKQEEQEVKSEGKEEEPVKVEEVVAQVEEVQGAKEGTEQKVDEEPAVDQQIQEGKEAGVEDEKDERVETEDSDVIPDVQEGMGINTVSIDAPIHTLPLSNSPIKRAVQQGGI